MGSIPRLKQRLECFSFKQRFNAQLHSLYDDVGLVSSACAQLADCVPVRARPAIERGGGRRRSRAECSRARPREMKRTLEAAADAHAR